MSRLSIEISEEQHKKIKALAALTGKSIKDLILDKVFSLSNDEQKAWVELENLLLPRIENAENNISKKSIGEITNEILNSQDH